MINNAFTGLLLAVLLSFSVHSNAVEVRVQGLFKGAAVLMIDGKQRMLKAGKRSPEGVLLVTADTKKAIVEIDGKRHTMTLSKQITSNYTEIERAEVAIPRNKLNQYITNALINGKRIKVLVDTGANSIALSSDDAKRLGIDYKKGKEGQVSTASGVAKAYSVTLGRVALGALAVKGVPAVVIEGSYPATVLLGMTYLNHVELREQGGTLYLRSKY